MKSYIRLFLLWVPILIIGVAQAQSFSNDFENQPHWNYPWTNFRIINDPLAPESNHICLCDSIHEYGFGFNIGDTIMGHEPFQRNLNCQLEFLFKASGHPTQALFVVSIDDAKGNRFWQAYPLAEFANDTTDWSRFYFNINFPYDYFHGAQIKGYMWNRGHEVLCFDDARLEVKPIITPSYLPEIEKDSSTPIWPFDINAHDIIPIVEYIDSNGDTLTNTSVMETRFETTITFSDPNYWELDETDRNLQIKTETTFKEDVKLLRLAFVVPLPDGKITVYRRNQHIDTTLLQPSYYLDREGFSITNDTFSISTYHNTGISSLQLDVEQRTACFNIDYWRDHPLLHYPMRSDTSDYFEDISYREIKEGDVLKGEFSLFYNGPEELPRIMPVWDGYQSAFIFTEHADWTDLRTHRAALFGNENITRPEDATGGFCHFNIPVTKSVFYWNPDQVTNEKTSEGNFPGLVASIKTDKEFLKLLKTIKKEGFEICLHSPEIYTTIPSEFPKAMRFMKRNFGSVTWIDHGYNNGPDKNREDLVCDGLLPESPYFAADLWKKNGVRYLWNAYYEEHRMEDFNFDSHFVQPYDGFGDALPNRQITTLPNGSNDFVLWSTPSTLEVNEDNQWYYFFDSKRLQHLVDQHVVFITHIYPGWTNLWRGFWQYNENGTIVAMPGFNFALGQLARLRDEKKILPTTIEQYLSHYEKLQKLDYQIIDKNTIRLTNHSEAIKGLTLLCAKPIVVEDKIIDFRKVGEGYLVWFDMGRNETVTVKYRE